MNRQDFPGADAPRCPVDEPNHETADSPGFLESQQGVRPFLPRGDAMVSSRRRGGWDNGYLFAVATLPTLSSYFGRCNPRLAASGAIVLDKPNGHFPSGPAQRD